MQKCDISVNMNFFGIYHQIYFKRFIWKNISQKSFFVIKTKIRPIVTLYVVKHEFRKVDPCLCPPYTFRLINKNELNVKCQLFNLKKSKNKTETDHYIIMNLSTKHTKPNSWTHTELSGWTYYCKNNCVCYK